MSKLIHDFDNYGCTRYVNWKVGNSLKSDLLKPTSNVKKKDLIPELLLQKVKQKGEKIELSDIDLEREVLMAKIEKLNLERNLQLSLKLCPRSLNFLSVYLNMFEIIIDMY
jgi:hypothetical protein